VAVQPDVMLHRRQAGEVVLGGFQGWFSLRKTPAWDVIRPGAGVRLWCQQGCCLGKANSRSESRQSPFLTRRFLAITA
jgi:hypothetical protein